MEILKSATKVCLVLVVAAAIALNLLGMEAQESFKTISIMIVSFYFGSKSPELLPPKGK